jgi:hypothetical protein
MDKNEIGFKKIEIITSVVFFLGEKNPRMSSSYWVEDIVQTIQKCIQMRRVQQCRNIINVIQSMRYKIVGVDMDEVVTWFIRLAKELVKYESLNPYSVDSLFADIEKNNKFKSALRNYLWIRSKQNSERVVPGAFTLSSKTLGDALDQFVMSHTQKHFYETALEWYVEVVDNRVRFFIFKGEIRSTVDMLMNKICPWNSKHEKIRSMDAVEQTIEILQTRKQQETLDKIVEEEQQNKLKRFKYEQEQEEQRRREEQERERFEYERLEYEEQRRREEQERERFEYEQEQEQQRLEQEKIEREQAQVKDIENLKWTEETICSIQRKPIEDILKSKDKTLRDIHPIASAISASLYKDYRAKNFTNRGWWDCFKPMIYAFLTEFQRGNVTIYKEHYSQTWTISIQLNNLHEMYKQKILGDSSNDYIGIALSFRNAVTQLVLFNKKIFLEADETREDFNEHFAIATKIYDLFSEDYNIRNQQPPIVEQMLTYFVTAYNRLKTGDDPSQDPFRMDFQRFLIATDLGSGSEFKSEFFQRIAN